MTKANCPRKGDIRSRSPDPDPDPVHSSRFRNPATSFVKLALKTLSKGGGKQFYVFEPIKDHRHCHVWNT